MIYTLTLNPAVDYRMAVGKIDFGETNRASSEVISFGGKGINVSKVLKNLGVESVALGFCAGFTGDALLAHLEEYGIKHDFVSLSNGNTRINVKLHDENGIETEINAAGPCVLQEEMQILFEKMKSTVADGDTVVLSGSAPKGADANLYAEIMKLFGNKKVRFAVDATGELLTNTLPLKPFLIKPNRAELGAIAGKKLETTDEIIDAAKKLHRAGAENVLVSMGKDGAILVDASENVLKADAHNVVSIGTVGAGDSMVAGFLAGISEGAAHALALGNACGGATASIDGLATKDAVEKLMELI